jgi:hypothetical protein
VFVADEISLVNFVVADYSNPIVATDPKEYAAEEYDKTTREKASKMRKNLIEEGLKLGHDK